MLWLKKLKWGLVFFFFFLVTGTVPGQKFYINRNQSTKQAKSLPFGPESMYVLPTQNMLRKQLQQKK